MTAFERDAAEARLHPDLGRADPQTKPDLISHIFGVLFGGALAALGGFGCYAMLADARAGKAVIPNLDSVVGLLVIPFIFLLGVLILAVSLLQLFSWGPSQRGELDEDERRWRGLATSICERAETSPGEIVVQRVLWSSPKGGYRIHRYEVSLVKHDGLVLRARQAAAIQPQQSKATLWYDSLGQTKDQLRQLFDSNPHSESARDEEGYSRAVSGRIPARVKLDAAADPKIVIIEAGNVRIWASVAAHEPPPKPVPVRPDSHGHPWLEGAVYAVLISFGLLALAIGAFFLLVVFPHHRNASDILPFIILILLPVWLGVSSLRQAWRLGHPSPAPEKAAQPSPKAGLGYFGSLVFFLSGALACGLAGLAFRTLATQPSLEDARRAQAAIPHWRVADGTLDEVRVQQDVSPHQFDWHPTLVSYRYSVDGKELRGDRLARGENFRLYRYDAPTLEAFESKLKTIVSLAGAPKRGPTIEKGRNSHTIYTEDERVIRYFPAAPVTVYYDPAAPSSSLLDNAYDARPIEWIDYVGEHLFLGYFLGGLGLLVIMYSIAPLRDNLYGAWGGVRYDEASRIYEYHSVTHLQSLVMGNAGFMSLLIIYGIWDVNLRSNSPVGLFAQLFLWAVIVGFAAVAWGGLWCLFVHRRVIVNEADHTVTEETGYGPVFGIFVFRRTLDHSAVKSVSLRLSRFDGGGRIPSYADCEIALNLKDEGRLVIFSSKYSVDQKEPPPQVLEMAQDWAKALGLPCEVAGAPSSP